MKAATTSRNLVAWAGMILLAALPMTVAASAQPIDQTASIAPQPDSSRDEYERVTREMTLSAERKAALAADIDSVKKDFASITAALIQSAKTEKKLGGDIEEISDRLADLGGQRETIRRSLNERRDVLAEVLGALERMGLNPPPAILVKPEDALASVRSAILLGAVVPELRQQTEILIGEMKEMSRVVASIEAERQRLSAAVGEQLAEKQRLSLLLDEKQRLQSAAETELQAEQSRSVELAARAESLKDLIASLERQAAKEDAARSAAAEKQRRDDEVAALSVPESNRLMGTAPFEALKRQIPLPVTGRFARRFGSDDGNGGVMLGDTLATQSAAIVTAPADGHVLYAGPFRSYGQLLILNAGDGYHVVLAGMSRINVSLGQAVLAGEPIGAMGEARVASTAATSEMNTAQELYVEFRKDGKPVDPSPWWADRLSGRTGNGT